MADKKISALTSATLPLAGTEVLPIVQSSTTVKVATDNLTVKNVRSNATTGILQVAGPAAAATRVMTTPDANFTVARIDAAQSFTGDQTLSTGNLIQGTAAKGFNFTANTGAAGKTTQLLNWYEEGTWTPADNSGAGLTFSNLSGNCYYTRVGNLVTCIFNITFPVTADGTTCSITGLPFISKSTTNAIAGGHFTYSGSTTVMTILVGAASSQFFFYQFGGSNVINSDLSNKTIRGVITYMV